MCVCSGGTFGKFRYLLFKPDRTKSAKRKGKHKKKEA